MIIYILAKMIILTSSLSLLIMSAKLCHSVSEVLVLADQNDPDQCESSESNRWFKGPRVNPESHFTGARFSCSI